MYIYMMDPSKITVDMHPKILQFGNSIPSITVNGILHVDFKSKVNLDFTKRNFCFSYLVH